MGGDLVANALAFDRSGDALWVVRGLSKIEVRAWPSLGLIRFLDMPAALLAADPAQDRFAVVSSGEVKLFGPSLDLLGSLRLPPDRRAQALAFDDQGDLFVLDIDDQMDVDDRLVRLFQVSLSEDRFEEKGRFQLSSGVLGAALAPTKHRAFFVLDSFPSVHCVWNFLDPAPAPNRLLQDAAFHSLISVDVAPRDSALIYSTKVTGTFVGWLNATGEVETVVRLEKRPYGEPTFMKCPGRGGAAAMHPSGKEVATMDIMGRLTVCDPRDGRLVRDPVPLFGVGYRWETGNEWYK